MILLLAVCAYWNSSDSGDAAVGSVSEEVAIPGDAVVPTLPDVPIATGPELARPPVLPAPKSIPPQRIARTSELVAEYLSIVNVSERGDLARSIASMDDAESLRELTTLFSRARHPAEREALIAALGDTDFTTELNGKLALLITALGSQPRNVRDAALGVLAQIEDPRAVALIKKVASTDPDHEVREAAKALLAAK